MQPVAAAATGVAAAALPGLLPNAEVALSTMGIMLNINAWV